MCLHQRNLMISRMEVTQGFVVNQLNFFSKFYKIDPRGHWTAASSNHSKDQEDVLHRITLTGRELGGMCGPAGGCVDSATPAVFRPLIHT